MERADRSRQPGRGGLAPRGGGGGGALERGEGCAGAEPESGGGEPEVGGVEGEVSEEGSRGGGRADGVLYDEWESVRYLRVCWRRGKARKVGLKRDLHVIVTPFGNRARMARLDRSINDHNHPSKSPGFRTPVLGLSGLGCIHPASLFQGCFLLCDAGSINICGRLFILY